VLGAFDDAIEQHETGRPREDLVEMRGMLKELVDEARRQAAA
jgi:hypothetical protein